MTTGTDADIGDGVGVEPTARTDKPTLLGRIGKLFGLAPEGELVVPEAEPLMVTTPLRVAWGEAPFELMLGKVPLEFHPDLSFTGEESAGDREWIVHPGAAFYEHVPRFLRIALGASVVLGRTDDVQTEMFDFTKSVADRHVRVSNRKGELTIEPLEFDRPTSISTIASERTVWAARRDNIMRLPEVLGHPLNPFDDAEALDVIREVNAIFASEAYRELNEEGVPGGIIDFPEDMTVVLMGDVHARADNLLRVITEGGLLGALERGEACLVLLGDLIHSQEAGELEDMESSIFILDLFFMLKRRFPEGVFYIHGNHESFSPDVGKAGVPQGLLFRKHLKKRRGKAYVAEVEALFDALAFVALGNGFAACHGAPVRSKVTRNTLVNIQRYPGIQYELVWNRLRQSNRPAGYGKGSVKRFRRTLDLPKHAALVVGHTPLSSEKTLWLNIGDITGHHVVYSAHPHRVAAMVMSGGAMTPLEFVPEPALAYLEEASSAAGEQTH